MSLKRISAVDRRAVGWVLLAAALGALGLAVHCEEPGNVGAGGAGGLDLDGGAATLPTSPAPLPPLPRPTGSPEFRGAWVHWEDYRSPQAIVATLAKARRAGLNVLLPLANYPHQAMWRTPLLPLNPHVAPGCDPVREFVRQGRAAGVKVVPYLVMLNAGLTKPPGLNPEWYALDAKGARAGGWLIPGHPGVRDWLSSLVADLAGTGVDGVMFDYIRHEYGSDYDYSDFSRNQFLAEHGFDPLGLKQPVPVGDPAVWNRWRDEQVTELVRRCSAAARQVNPRVWVAAAGGTQRGDLHELHRDGRAWLARGLVDFLCPMAYSTENDKFRARLLAELEPLDTPAQRASLFAGVGAYKLGGKPQQVVQQIELARELGFRGVCLFAFENLDEPLVTALATGPFRAGAAVPLR